MHHYAAFATELKFVVEESLVHAIRDWIRAELSADPHASDPSGDGYQTSTLYYDTLMRDLYHRRGSYARAKYRIRRYNRSDLIFFERKMKVEGRLSKFRSDETLESLERLVSGKSAGNWSGHWFARRLDNRKLSPVCQIEYDRTARVGVENAMPLRLTLDVNLRATTIESPRFHDGPMMTIAPGRAVLELKFRMQVPELFQRFISEFNLSPQPFSKYRTAMRSLGLVQVEEKAAARESEPRLAGVRA